MRENRKAGTIDRRGFMRTTSCALVFHQATSACDRNTGPVPLRFESVGAAVTAAVGAAIKEVRVRVREPVTDGDAGRDATYVRVPLDRILAGAFPRSSYFRSADRFLPNEKEDAANGGYWLLNEPVVTPHMLGATFGADATRAIRDVMAYLASRGGGRMDGLGETYLMNSGGVEVSGDDILLENFVFRRTSAVPGWMVRFAHEKDTEGGGVRNARFVGVPTTANGNGGLLFGSTSHRASRWVAENITFEGFSQYGMGVAAGDEWQVDAVRILDHGLTEGAISSCIGFWVFPRLPSRGGQISNVHSEVSPACMANSSANSAAIKLQTHRDLRADRLTAIGGSEEAMAIDSVSGHITGVTVRAQGRNAGLAIGNHNRAHSFSGQAFTLDGFDARTIEGSPSQNNFVISGGEDGAYKLTGCTIRNGRGGGAGYLARSAVRDCTFENLVFEDIRFDSVSRGFPGNSAPSRNNRYVDVVARGGALTGVLFIEAEESMFNRCGVSAAEGDTVGTFQLRGSRNVVESAFADRVAGNAVTVIGDSNHFKALALGSVSGRSVWMQRGSDNNIVESDDLEAGRGALNDGSPTNRLGVARSQRVGRDDGG